MTKEQEREEEGQASPHPGLETLWAPGEERGVTELLLLILKNIPPALL